MMITFVLIATFVFGIAGTFWKTDSVLNSFIKIFMIALTVWGVGLILSNPNLFLVGT